MYKASIRNDGDLKFYATTRDHSFVLGLEGAGAHPVDTVLAGLCGCIGHYIQDFFHLNNRPCPGFDVRAEARSSADNSRLSDIALVLDFKQPDLATEEKQALLSHITRCKVHNTLKRACDISITLA